LNAMIPSASGCLGGWIESDGINEFASVSCDEWAALIRGITTWRRCLSANYRMGTDYQHHYRTNKMTGAAAPRNVCASRRTMKGRRRKGRGEWERSKTDLLQQAGRGEYENRPDARVAGVCVGGQKGGRMTDLLYQTRYKVVVAGVIAVAEQRRDPPACPRVHSCARVRMRIRAGFQHCRGPLEGWTHAP
jgi:hypothetical protein